MPEQPVQRSAVEVASMSAEQISEALHAGELAEYMAGNDLPAAIDQSASSGDAGEGAPLGQVSEEELRSMTPEQIVAARKAGRLLSLGIAP